MSMMTSRCFVFARERFADLSKEGTWLFKSAALFSQEYIFESMYSSFILCPTTAHLRVVMSPGTPSSEGEC